MLSGGEQPFFKYGQNPDTKHHFSQSPDRIKLTESRQTESGQTGIEQKIKAELYRHRTRFSGKSGQKLDKDRTRTMLSADVRPIPAHIKHQQNFFEENSKFCLLLGVKF